MYVPSNLPRGAAATLRYFDLYMVLLIIVSSCPAFSPCAPVGTPLDRSISMPRDIAFFYNGEKLWSWGSCIEFKNSVGPVSGSHSVVAREAKWALQPSGFHHPKLKIRLRKEEQTGGRELGEFRGDQREEKRSSGQTGDPYRAHSNKNLRLSDNKMAQNTTQCAVLGKVLHNFHIFTTRQSVYYSLNSFLYDGLAVPHNSIVLVRFDSYGILWYTPM